MQSIRKRNYSFLNSKRLPEERMTEVNGIIIPSMPGTLYHSVLCALAEYSNKVVPWERIYTLSEKYMRQYGGAVAWQKFYKKQEVKSYQKRIRNSIYSLTRCGKNCYGYRLHERGMSIYYFSDGAMMLTGGEFIKQGSKYGILFSDGRGLQYRYKGRGNTMSSREYTKFLAAGYIDASGKMLDEKAIENERKNIKNIDNLPNLKLSNKRRNDRCVEACISLSEDYNQNTADRFQRLGVIIETVLGDQLIAQIPIEILTKINEDPDVMDLEILT
jgi:hypothetical protein